MMNFLTKFSTFFCLSLGIIFFDHIIVIGALQKQRIKREPCGQAELNKFDELISDILPFSDPKVRLPEKLDDIPKFCLYYGDVLVKIEALNKRCMKETNRNIITLMIHDIKQKTKNICSKKAIKSKKMTPAKKQFLQLNQCVNKGSEKLKRCSYSASRYLSAIEKVPKTQRIPMLCCEMIKVKNCLKEALTSSPGCNEPEFEEQLRNLFKSFNESSVRQVHSICGDYSTRAKCSKVKLPKSKKTPKNQKTFIKSVIHLLEDL